MRPDRGQSAAITIQFYGVAVTLVWSGGVTFVLLRLVSGLAAAGLRPA